MHKTAERWFARGERWVTDSEQAALEGVEAERRAIYARMGRVGKFFFDEEMEGEAAFVEIEQEMANVADTSELGGLIGQQAARAGADDVGYVLLEEEIETGEATVNATKSFWTFENVESTIIAPVLVFANAAWAIYDIAARGAPDSLADRVNDWIAIASTVPTAVQAGVAIYNATASAEAVEAFAGTAEFIGTVCGGLLIVAAVIGVGFVIWEANQTPPDPLAEFYTGYVEKAGFGLPNPYQAIDYATRYTYIDANGDNALDRCGFALRTKGAADPQCLIAQSDGKITLGALDYRPESVWTQQTTGLGLTIFMAGIERPVANSTRTERVAMLLTLMSDDTVSFQPLMGSVIIPADATVKPVTQTWVVTAPGSVTTVNVIDNPFLNTLDIQLRPVFPDASGAYLPANARDYIHIDAQNQLGRHPTGSTFTLTMEGRKPFGLFISDVYFKKGVQSTTITGPTLSDLSSGPVKYALKPESSSGTIPAFVEFDETTGNISQKQKVAVDKLMTGRYVLTATSALGSVSTTFTINVIDDPTLVAVIHPIEYPSETVTTPKGVFQSKTFAMPAVLDSEKRYYISGSQIVLETASVHDVLAIKLGGTTVFSFDYGQSGKVQRELVEIPWSVMDKLKGQNVTVECQNTRAGEVSATALSLLSVFAPDPADKTHPFDHVYIRGSNASKDTRLRVYFITDTDPTWNEAKAEWGEFTKGGGPVNVTVDMSDNPNWKGTITGLRVDPLIGGGENAGDGWFNIEYVKVGTADAQFAFSDLDTALTSATSPRGWTLHQIIKTWINNGVWGGYGAGDPWMQRTVSIKTNR
ncbi:MAG TPA: hypothetical protein VD886_12420 [Herpetosiphonaceae bacterium]|nr:hypothetical protein [Herpetosiphonaceae bacterium]